MIKKINKFEKNPKGLMAITASVKHVFYAPVRSFVIILVMSLASFFALASYILWENVDAFYENWNKSVEITIYLKKNIAQEKTDTLVGELKENKVISVIEVIGPKDGMKMFVENTSLTSFLSSFKDNPLPGVIVVYPKVKNLSRDEALKFIQMLQDRPEVDIVKADIDWIEQSYHWLTLLDKAIKFFVFLLMLNALFVLCGISFAMTSVFREKDHLSKIVLQYQFAWYGFLSGLFSLLMTRIGSLILQDSGIFLVGFKMSDLISFVFVCAAISLISSRMAVPAS